MSECNNIKKEKRWQNAEKLANDLQSELRKATNISECTVTFTHYGNLIYNEIIDIYKALYPLNKILIDWAGKESKISGKYSSKIEELEAEAHTLTNVDKNNSNRTFEFYKAVAGLVGKDKEAISLLKLSNLARLWISLGGSIKEKTKKALNQPETEWLSSIRGIFL